MLVRFCCLCVHPLVAYRLQKQSWCTCRSKDQQRSPSRPTHSVEVILKLFFVLFFFFFLKHNSVNFKTLKKEVSLCCNNHNKKNYRPLSRKKREESVAAHFCQIALRRRRALSVGERCKHPPEESRGAAAAPRWPRPEWRGGENPQRPGPRLSAGPDISPDSPSPADSLLLSSHY